MTILSQCGLVFIHLAAFSFLHWREEEEEGGGEIKKECDEGIVGRTVVVYESNLSSATAAFFLYVKAL